MPQAARALTARQPSRPGRHPGAGRPASQRAPETPGPGRPRFRGGHRMPDDKRVLYISAVYDEAEIEAVNRVLASGKLSIGANVAEMERRVAELCGKRYGIMCNSGSS